MKHHDDEFEFLAHDLRQLLWAIQGRAQALGATASGELADGLAQITDHATAAAEMLAGDQSGTCSPIEVAAAAWSQTCRPGGPDLAAPARWQLELPDTAPAVAVAPTILRRVFANLFTNALEAMPAGGKVSCLQTTAEQQLHWTVSDSGPGLGADIVARLFTVGATWGKPTGHGLGLAGARAILRRHGGDLRYDPAGPGATFMVSLPVAGSLETSPSPVTDRPFSRSLRLLVVDDEASVRGMLSELLLLDGHRVDFANDHDSALAEFVAGTYDSALLDLGLPGRSGLELARRLRAIDPALAVILLSGWGRENELSSVDPDLVEFTGVKPVDQSALRDLLTQAARATARRRSNTAKG